MQKRKSNYKSFRESYIRCVKNDPPESIREVALKLYEYGFNGSKEPKPKQINIAWQWTKEEFFPEGQPRLEFYFRKEYYNNRYVDRATKPVMFNGKQYKKGQFLPKNRGKVEYGPYKK